MKWLEQLDRQSEGLKKCMDVCMAENHDMNCLTCRLWHYETGCEAYGLDCTEIFKLHNMLTAAKIPHTFLSGIHGGYQVYYPFYKRRKPVCSAILHAHSYGAFVGKIEIMGLLTEEEANESPVLGYLTADDVFKRIEKHWKENKA